jgi:hypothetical protein
MRKDSFLKVYSNLPIGVRNDVVLVLDKEGPITWDVAYAEIKEETELGEIIFNKLIELGFLIQSEDVESKKDK